VKKTFELGGDPRELPLLRKDLRLLLREAGFDDKASGGVVLAVAEVVTNIIRHAYQGGQGKIEVGFLDEPDYIKISIRDFGRKFDPTKASEPELPPTRPGGLGIYLTKRLVDEVKYDPEIPEGNLLHLIKHKKEREVRP
jgi:anti-sigma regulatory factor (Ser/Thr protein kinase)